MAQQKYNVELANIEGENAAEFRDLIGAGTLTITDGDAWFRDVSFRDGTYTRRVTPKRIIITSRASGCVYRFTRTAPPVTTKVTFSAEDVDAIVQQANGLIEALGDVLSENQVADRMRPDVQRWQMAAEQIRNIAHRCGDKS